VTAIQNTLQTNGTLLDVEWRELFHENNFLVGLSLDGPREMHDCDRVAKGGQPTFDKVNRTVRLIQRHHVEFNVLTTVHRANGDHLLEVYRFLRDKVGTRFIRLIPIVECTTADLRPPANLGWGVAHHSHPLYTLDGNMVTERTVRPEQWGQVPHSHFRRVGSPRCRYRGRERVRCRFGIVGGSRAGFCTSGWKEQRLNLVMVRQ